MDLVTTICDWSEKIMAGDLGCKIIAIPKHKIHTKTINNLNLLGSMLQTQTLNSEKQIRLHTEHTKTISIIKERETIAHELHDSLAQTIASIKLQMRVLDELLQTTINSELSIQVEKLENSINEAYSELRTIISEFRAPVIGQSFNQRMNYLVQKFQDETEVMCYLQNELDKNPSQKIQIQLLRITSETLTNIKKYANANVVRILLNKNDKLDRYQMLIEDDGVGFVYKKNIDNKDGFHLGLNIMADRAYQIGAKFNIESERGEGCRILVENIKL
ncbi:MAG: hypothetical protein DRQ51_08315 [Gammaproteobacteria bacterium]|nr:MAG: hypothetical protein DRQ51_08315 [Gammaproteobacteria bacterium]